MWLKGSVQCSKTFKAAPWRNEALNERFVELHKLGQSFSIIAAKLNDEFGCSVSRNACIGRAARLGLEGRETTIHLPRRQNLPRKPRVHKVKLIAKLRPSYRCDPVEVSKVNAGALHLSVVDLERSQCRYPFGDGPFTFCGLKAFDGQSYCELHFALTHSKTNEPPREKFRVSRFSGHVAVAA